MCMSWRTPSVLQALLTGIVQKGERKINWRSPALFKGVEVERNLSRPRLLQLLRDYGV